MTEGIFAKKLPQPEHGRNAGQEHAQPWQTLLYGVAELPQQRSQMLFATVKCLRSCHQFANTARTISCATINAALINAANHSDTAA